MWINLFADCFFNLLEEREAANLTFLRSCLNYRQTDLESDTLWCSVYWFLKLHFTCSHMNVPIIGWRLHSGTLEWGSSSCTVASLIVWLRGNSPIRGEMLLSWMILNILWTTIPSWCKISALWSVFVLFFCNFRKIIHFTRLILNVNLKEKQVSSPCLLSKFPVTFQV